MNDEAVHGEATRAPVLETLNADTVFFPAQGAIVEQRRSAFQTIEVLETPGHGRALRLDGIIVKTEKDEFFHHENLVHIPAVAHPKPQRVLIIGGGDGGALEELLKHACVECVSVVERDAAVVELSSRHLRSINHGAFQDPRVTLHFCEGRAWLTARDERYDLLLLDLGDPLGSAHRLYTAEFYRLCRENLSPGGILALRVQSPVTHPHTFARIVRTLRSVFKHVRPYLVFVPAYGTWCAMATASMSLDPLDDTAEGLIQRLQERSLSGLHFYNAATHFAAFALPNFALDLVRADVALVTDAGERLDRHPEMRGAIAPETHPRSGSRSRFAAGAALRDMSG